MEVMDQCTQCGCVLLRTQEGLCASCLLQAGLGDSGVFRLDFEKLLIEAADRSDTAPNRAESMLPTREFASEAVENLESAAQQAIDQSNPDQTRTFGGAPTGNEGLENPTAELNPDELSLDFLTPSEKPDCLGTLGIYEITEVIGRGGFGIVLKAFDPNLNRAAAIKILSPELASDPTARKRFLREARSAAAVSHANVVEIYEIDNNAVLPYLVMEFVDGATLDQRIKQQGPLSIEEILRIGTQTAAGLAAAHAQGLIHRDIKPANILVPAKGDCTKITDFGLARTAEDAHLTRTGTLAGTPQYMSPEQADGKDLDSRCDLFSLGGVLYAMCTGKAPFRAENTVAVLQAVCDEEPPSIAKLNRNAPKWLAEIIAKLQAKNPDDRFQSADEVAKLLEEHLAHLQNPNENERPKRVRVSQSAKPRRSLVAAAVLFVVLGGLALTEATGITNVVNFVATVLRIQTPDGTLVVKVDDPNIKIEVTKDGTVIINGAGPQDLRLHPGRYHVKASNGGRTKTEWITIERGGRRILEVHFEPDVAAKGPAVKAKSQWPADAPPLAIAPFDADRAKKHQEAWANHLGVPVEKEIVLGKNKNGKDVTLTMVLIPPGEFMMGSNAEDQAKFIAATNEKFTKIRFGDEVPQHRVRITRPFYLGKYELTRNEWQTVTGSNPSGFKLKPEHPVEMVSWNDIQSFLSKLNKDASPQRMTFALPTEAQWEYACRAGTTTAWHFGDSADNVHQYAQVRKPNIFPAKRVGWLKPNAFGLHDMHGNVWEWCNDWYGREYYAKSPLEDPRGPSPNPLGRVKRGGARTMTAVQSRSANRGSRPPDYRGAGVGFRLAAALPGDVIQPKLPQLAKVPVAGKDGWIELFNGKDLTGWKTHPKQPGNWRVENGVLVADGPPLSHLFSKRGDYRNFHVYMEVKISDRGDSGLYFRSKDEANRVSSYTGHHYPAAYEAQIRCGAADKNEPLKPRKLHPQFGRLTHFPDSSEKLLQKSSATMPLPDTWIALEVIAVGNHVVTKLNGQVAVDFHDGIDRYPQGHFALQCGWWTTKVQVRKMLIKEFPTSLAEVANWLTKNWRLQEVIKLGPEVDRLLAKGDVNETDANHLNSLGAAFGRGADWQRAGKLLDLFLERHPENYWYWHHRLSVAACIGDKVKYEHCCNEIARLIESQADDSNANIAATVKSASFEPKKTRLAKARALAKRLEEKWPDEVGSLHARALVLYAEGDTDGCRKLLKQIPIDAGNQFFKIRTALLSAECAAKSGDQPTAKEALEQATQLLEAQCSSGDLGHPKCWVVAESVARIREAEIAIHGKAVTPQLTPKRLANLVIERISSLPAAEQVEAVLQELKRRNPEFDGKWWKHTIQNGAVTGLAFCTDDVADISPVRTLTRLRVLKIKGQQRLQRIDLSPLKGMNLTKLEVMHNLVDDLSPLRGMPLEHLHLWSSFVGSDLTPLEGMPLKWLNIGGGGKNVDLTPLAGLPLDYLCLNYRKVSDLTPLKNTRLRKLDCTYTLVSDLSPLRKLPLIWLAINNSKVTDLSPIKNLPLEELWCDFEPSRDAAFLRKIKTLTKINGNPADEFWKGVEKQGNKSDDEQPQARGNRHRNYASGIVACALGPESRRL